jgi:UDP-glucuronate decarboxylase
MMRMMDQDETTGPVNLGNPVETSMLELAETVLRMTGSKSQLKFVPLPKDDPKQRCPDITKAKKFLGGWSPRVPLETGLSRAIEHYRAVLAKDSHS